MADSRRTDFSRDLHTFDLTVQPNLAARGKDDSLSGAIHADVAEMARSRAEPSRAESKTDRAERQVRSRRFMDFDVAVKLTKAKTKLT